MCSVNMAHLPVFLGVKVANDSWPYTTYIYIYTCNKRLKHIVCHVSAQITISNVFMKPVMYYLIHLKVQTLIFFIKGTKCSWHLMNSYLLVQLSILIFSVTAVGCAWPWIFKVPNLDFLRLRSNHFLPELKNTITWFLQC